MRRVRQCIEEDVEGDGARQGRGRSYASKRGTGDLRSNASLCPASRRRGGSGEKKKYAVSQSCRETATIIAAGDE